MLGAFAGLSAFLALTTPTLRALSKAPVSGRNYAVATENETVSRTAIGVLEHGGNAIDAAVTACLTAGLASPTSSGMGGGGFAVIWTAATHQISAFDFRETAPRGLDVGALERRPLEPPERGKLVGVPGEVFGLHEIHEKLGKLPWADIVRPAVGVATNGFPASTHLASIVSFVGPKLSVDASLSELFLPKGKAVVAGARLTNPRLAATLKRVAAEGPKALYEGSIAAELESSAASAGGALTVRDLAEYKMRTREPLHIKWEGYDIYTMGLPSGGGLMLAETLGVLTAQELKALGFNSGGYGHLVGEAIRGALADRVRFATDPDVQAVDVPHLLSEKRLGMRKRSFTPNLTHPLPAFTFLEHGTHHMVFADREGNIVSLTTTVNHPFGAMITGKTSGIVLNDELDDFTQASSIKNLGVPVSPNRPRPLARPVSSMTPTIVLKDGVPVLALGGSGGMTISPGVAQVLLSRLVFNATPDQAVTSPRFMMPTEGATISVDPSTTPDVRADLSKRGEVVTEQKWMGYAVQAIAFEGGKKLPASDPRKHGTALAE
ncbi:MAG TPA: gamma-glutamyltransferase family protein [Polyangiaceae bacterium]|jgi:gamma-glutamyltranspeptidase/glutathione hydrolase|nr:gamma-glutamyltransferase family protein [Polyangiaceae bacterium]